MTLNRNRFIVTALLTFLALSCSAQFAIADDSIVHSPAHDLNLRDIADQEHVPFADPETTATVFVFVSNDCPIANGYQPTLKKLAQEYPAPAFRWFMIHVNSKLSTEVARQHAKDYQIELPIIVDTNHEIVRKVGATKIPEVFVFAREQQQAIYRGRIDDLHVAFGKKRISPTTHDLANALQAIQDKTRVSVPQTEAVGCSITIQDESSAAPGKSGLDTNKPEYDPLKVSKEKIESQLFEVKDENRSREIPIRVYLPKDSKPAPVILFSHGLGGSRDNSAYLGNHWAGRGFVAVFMQHVGSDESVWKGKRPREIMEAMKKAANAENFSLRVKDVSFIIDQLEKWNKEAGHTLQNRLDLERLGMTGHSFGAVTTQAVSGQQFMGRTQLTDPRIKAAIPMSPSVPRAGSAEKGFGAVSIPWLLMTGTEDTSPIGDTSVENRLSVYPALPKGNKYELVLHDGTHSAFSELAGGGERGKRNPNHHRVILALSTAFWEAYLKQDSAAREWLDSDSVRGVMEKKDRWQKK